MININLLPEEIRENIDYSKKNKKILKYFKMLIVACLFFLISFVFLYVSLMKSNNYFLENIKDSDKVIDSYSNVLGDAKELDGKVSMIENIKKDYKFWSKLNYTLNRVAPEGLYIAKIEPRDVSKLLPNDKNISEDGANVETKITGYAKTKNDIGMFRDALASQKGFKIVNVELIKEEDPDRNSFTIKLFMSEEATDKGKK